MFTAKDYRILSDIVFQDSYPGYKKNVVESPNGDDNWDDEKRYAHVAMKYLEEYKRVDSDRMMWLLDYLNTANSKAVEVAIELGVPKAFWPDVRYGALRILEYPPGSIAHSHVDFDLFTLMCYRNVPDAFRYSDSNEFSDGLRRANELNSQIHFGEILELVIPRFPATPHEVSAMEQRTQYSIVYFAIPDHESILPDGTSVGAWLDERLSRSRKTVD